MVSAAALIQSDPAVVNQLERLATIQIVVAIALIIVALAALGVAVGVLFAIRKLVATVERVTGRLMPRVDPLLTSATRIAGDAEDVAALVKVRVGDVLHTVDEINERLRSGVETVETRLRHFGAVVDVIQAETENLLLDAASTARGVHTAAEVLRAGPQPEAPEEDTDEEDVFAD